MAVQIIDGLLQTKCHNKHKPSLQYGGLDRGVTSTYKLLARFMVVLALIIVILPLSTLRSILNEESAGLTDSIKPKVVDLEMLSMLFHDLYKGGILKMGSKGLMLSNDDEETIQISLFLRRSELEFSSVLDFERQSSIPNESFDFTFTQNFPVGSQFIDRTLKVGGMVAIQLSGSSFDKPDNYRTVYFRRFGSNVMVMKKVATRHDAKPISSSTVQRRLLEYTPEAKRAALRNLEDVLLEPPRASSRRSKSYLKRTKYLPDLLGDTLESYPRRIFIDVGKEGCNGGTDWFTRNYPTRNLKFEMYKIETVTQDQSFSKTKSEIGMSDWLMKNVKEAEFVVMKADAEVVEDMVKSKAVRLVDELFLECKPLGYYGRKNMNKRAYWECLALYGKLRDEGVSVHQWWG